MTNDQFEQMAVRLEERARRKPALYAVQVLLLGLLGNAYLAAVLARVVAALIVLLFSLSKFGFLGVKLVLVLGAFLWVVRALWVKIGVARCNGKQRHIPFPAAFLGVTPVGLNRIIRRHDLGLATIASGDREEPKCESAVQRIRRRSSW